MSYFITDLVFILIDLHWILAIDGRYIYSEFLIYATDIGKFETILEKIMCLEFFIFGSPTLLYMFLSILDLSIFIFVNPTITSFTVVKHWNFL